MKLTKQQEDVLKKIDAVTKDRDGLLAKEGLTTGDIDAAKAKNTEIKTLQAQFDALGEAEGLKGWDNAPTNRVPLPGADGGSESDNGVDMLGYTKAGHALIGWGEQGAGGALKMIEQVGPGVFGEKTYKALCEPSYAKAFNEYLHRGERTGMTWMKDLQEGLDPQGGVFAPPQMIARIISRQATPTRVAGLVTTLTTSSAAAVMPKVNYADSNELYSTGFRVTYTGENGDVAGETKVSDDKLFGSSRIDVFTAMMTTQVPNDFIEDSGIDIMSWLSGKLGETADLEADSTIINGSGVGRPLGIIPAIGTDDGVRVVNSGHATQLTADGVIKLVYSIPEQYIDNCRSLCNRTSTGLALRLLKDANNRYLFGSFEQSGLANERSPQLVGYPNLFSGFMPNVAADAYPLIFGDWQGYYRLLRLGLSIQILREKYAEKNRVGIVARMRAGGRPVEPWRLAAQKVSA